MIITKLFCKSGVGKCKDKPRYLGNALGSAKIDELICATCKHRNKFDIRVKEKQHAK